MVHVKTTSPFDFLSLPPELQILVILHLAPQPGSLEQDLNVATLRSLSGTCRHIRRLAIGLLDQVLEYKVSIDGGRIATGHWRSKLNDFMHISNSSVGLIRCLKFPQIKPLELSLDFVSEEIQPWKLLDGMETKDRVEEIHMSSFPWPSPSVNAMSRASTPTSTTPPPAVRNAASSPFEFDIDPLVDSFQHFSNITTLKVWEGDIGSLLELPEFRKNLRSLTCEVSNWEIWNSIRGLETLKTLDWVVYNPEPFEEDFLEVLSQSYFEKKSGQEFDGCWEFTSAPSRLSFVHPYNPLPTNSERNLSQSGTDFDFLDQLNPVIDYFGMKAVLEIFSRQGGLQMLEILNVEISDIQDIQYAEQRKDETLILKNLTFTRFFQSQSLSNPSMIQLISDSPNLKTLSIINFSPYQSNSSCPNHNLNLITLSAKASSTICKLINIKSTKMGLKNWNFLEVDRQFWNEKSEYEGFQFKGGKVEFGRECEWEDVQVNVFREWEGWRKCLVE
jgi:hypothetical protein